MPHVDITPKLQLVVRHTYLTSDDANGVRLARYENQLDAGRGDRYNEGYFGVNYYVYGHKLKLQGGVQFADMNDHAGDGGDYSGVAATTGLRVSW
jgi:phosphate-selective porin OprO/OprP